MSLEAYTQEFILSQQVAACMINYCIRNKLNPKNLSSLIRKGRKLYSDVYGKDIEEKIYSRIIPDVKQTVSNWLRRYNAEKYMR